MKGMKVEVRNNNVDAALKVFRKKSAPIVMEVRNRQEYTKPTTERNRAKRAAEAREKRRQKQPRPWV